jgi:predicted O-methyltransferase YrrM
VTLEANARYAEIAQANVAQAGFADVVEVRVGPALDTLPALAAEGAGPFDLVFIDADKRSNPEYLRWALELSRRPGALIVADNVVRSGAVADAGSDDPSVVGVRRFLDLVAAEPRLTATAIQTVGEKGHDGFVLALVVGG